MSDRCGRILALRLRDTRQANLGANYRAELANICTLHGGLSFVTDHMDGSVIRAKMKTWAYNSRILARDVSQMDQVTTKAGQSQQDRSFSL
ncbi:hypothetical protein RRG08_010341 [Elysia crispata]|uniref:Uncharacterized protein n=1 Tax=Elysia crispata TaxID=231223 RepID=A0AAE1AYX3_9GAST|nr:hypothetical protein RRG08_010341 [Elysia crispata]